MKRYSIQTNKKPRDLDRRALKANLIKVKASYDRALARPGSSGRSRRASESSNDAK